MKKEKINNDNIKTFYGVLPFNSEASYTTDLNQVNKDFSDIVKDNFYIVSVDEFKNTFTKVENVDVPENIRLIQSKLFKNGKSVIEKEDIETNNRIKAFFKDFIDKLSEGKFTYLSNWIFTNDYKTFPIWFKGKHFKREGRLPQFIEWIKDQNMTDNALWWHGTWGFIMNKDSFENWTNNKISSKENIQKFVEEMYACFVVEGEVDKMKILIRENDINND